MYGLYPLSISEPCPQSTYTVYSPRAFKYLNNEIDCLRDRERQWVVCTISLSILAMSPEYSPRAFKSLNWIKVSALCPQSIYQPQSFQISQLDKGLLPTLYRLYRMYCTQYAYRAFYSLSTYRQMRQVFWCVRM